MPNWDAILNEAERLAESLLKQNVDLSEAEKLLHYFVYKGCDSTAISKYLSEMSENPPPRSRRSQMYFSGLKRIWEGWKTDLGPEDKARAWGWAVRQVRAKRSS